MEVLKVDFNEFKKETKQVIYVNGNRLILYDRKKNIETDCLHGKKGYTKDSY